MLPFALAVFAVVLGIIDVENRAVDGDLAVAASVPHAIAAAVPPTATRLVDARARAASALRRGDVATAAALIPAGDDERDIDLRARVAQARGDVAGATALYARVGDATRAEAAIDALRAQGDLAAATRAQGVLVAHYDGAGGLVPEAAADAWWRLGVLRATAAWQHSGAQRTRERRLALAAYERALALSPNEQTYLLAVGEAELELGDSSAARRAYVRALDAGPASADAALGLVHADAVAGNCAAARTEIPRAARNAAGAGRPWPAALDHPASPWDDAVHRCGL